MAKARAICTCSICGATFKKTAVNHNRREADSWEEWAEQVFTTCPDCEQKQHEEAAKAYAEQAAAQCWATLVGSPKQVTWAEQIRASIVEDAQKSFDRWAEDAKIERSLGHDEKAAKLERSREVYTKLLQDLLHEQNRSGWWIDRRQYYATEVLAEYYRDRHRAALQ